MQRKESRHRNRPAPPIETLTEPTNERAKSLIAYWRSSLGADGALPDRSAFDPAHLRPWLGSISIYRAVDAGTDFKVTLDGTEIVEMTGEDWTGRRTSEIDLAYDADLTGMMREIIASREPCIQRIGLLQKQWAYATRVSLPIARSDGDCDIVMAIFAD